MYEVRVEVMRNLGSLVGDWIHFLVDLIINSFLPLYKNESKLTACSLHHFVRCCYSSSIFSFSFAYFPESWVQYPSAKFQSQKAMRTNQCTRLYFYNLWLQIEALVIAVIISFTDQLELRVTAKGEGVKGKGKAIPLWPLAGLLDSRRLRLPGFPDNWHLKVAGLSDLRTGRLYPPGKVPGTHFC